MLAPPLDPKVIATFRAHVRTEIAKQQHGPADYVKCYDMFASLIDRSAETELADFLNAEHKFEDYCKEILKIEHMLQELSFNRRALSSVGYFSVNCESLNRELTRRAQALLQKLIARMQQDSQVRWGEKGYYYYYYCYYYYYYY